MTKTVEYGDGILSKSSFFKWDTIPSFIGWELEICNREGKDPKNETHDQAILECGQLEVNPLEIPGKLYMKGSQYYPDQGE